MSSKVYITVCLVTVATKWNIWNPVFPDNVGFFVYFIFITWVLWYIPLVWALGRHRKADLCEFRPARATQWGPVSKTNKQEKAKEEEKKKKKHIILIAASHMDSVPKF